MTSRVQRCNHGLMGMETQLYAGKGKVKAKKSRLSGSLGYDAFELRVSYGVMPVGLSSFASPHSAELPFSKGFITTFYTDNENFYINSALVSFNFRLTWKWRLKPTALFSAATLLGCSKPSGATALLMKSQLIRGNRQGVSRASVTSSESLLACGVPATRSSSLPVTLLSASVVCEYISRAVLERHGRHRVFDGSLGFHVHW